MPEMVRQALPDVCMRYDSPKCDLKRIEGSFERTSTREETRKKTVCAVKKIATGIDKNKGANEFDKVIRE